MAPRPLKALKVNKAYKHNIDIQSHFQLAERNQGLLSLAGSSIQMEKLILAIIDI